MISILYGYMVFSGPLEVSLWPMVCNKRHLIKKIKKKTSQQIYKELCQKMYEKKNPLDFSQILSAFIHSHICSSICLFIQHISIENPGCSRSWVH